MDGVTLLYSNRNELDMDGTIGQEYCFYATSEVDVPDSTTVISSDTTEVTNSDLFFSEYAEGSSNNKYLEIYNGTGADVDLSNYLIMQNSNGGPWDEYVDTLSGTLANGDVYVIANASADASILAEADLTGSGICYFNGDDARALIKVVAGDTTVLDYIGSFPDDPGSGWDVGGVTNATKDHTLVRKSTITSGDTSWTTSAGTNTADSEWIVHDQNTWSYLGSHTMYVVTWDTTYDITWHTEYSAPSDTVCGTPVEQLLCSVTNYNSISSYTELNLNWTAPFRPGHVEAWGWFYQGAEAPEIENVTKISAGWEHGLFLKSDSTVFNWPTGGYLDIPGNANYDFIDIAAGWYFNIGLRSDGTMYGWWYSEQGQGEPPDSVTNAVAIAAGNTHAMALRSDSTVVAWGSNDFGESDVPAGLNSVIQIDAGDDWSAALKSDGTVVVWGQNNYGQTDVPGDLTDVVEIACGGYHMVALKSDGSIVAWGRNNYGQTGTPTTLGTVEKIAAGGQHTMVLQ
ncbi:MAG TPA: lamin tail domain-containing protein, partial [Candidatus Marinimicrobia bacterium]|nr:lamin tail domain-containing protein [Candidatus Neomarinimicrobiota bacterium]